MPPRKTAIGASREHLGGGDEPIVNEIDPAALGDAVESLGEAVTANLQAEQGTADAEGQHTGSVRAMNNITEQLEISTGEMVFDVRDFLLDTIKARPKPWPATSQAEQRDVAAACEHAATELVRKVAEAVAARGVNPVRVLLTKVTLGDDIVIAGKVKTFDDEEEDSAVNILHHARGKHVMLTVASVDDYRGEGRDAETDADQPGFGFEGDTDLAGDDDDEGGDIE